jgi:hypothetical protein
MDRGLITAIVDRLRRGKEEEALAQGGPTVGAQNAALQARSRAAQMAPAGMGLRGVAPKHNGEDINEIIDRMSR